MRFGIIGDPVSHSKSPQMHEAAYNVCDIDATYTRFHIAPEDLENEVSRLKKDRINGFNVTIPHKETIIPMLDSVDESASAIGAVNTVVNREGRYIGYNTDGLGFVLALKEEADIDPNGMSVCIIGAGGSAKGISHALVSSGISELTIINRTMAKAHDISTRYSNVKTRALSLKDPLNIGILHDADIVINTTPIGMMPDMELSPMRNMSWVRRDQLVCDIIYVPAVTRFLKDASDKGAHILGGAGMLAGQGILAFELFTGQRVPYSVMRNEV